MLLRSSPAAGVPFVSDFVAGVPTIALYYFVEKVKDVLSGRGFEPLPSYEDQKSLFILLLGSKV